MPRRKISWEIAGFFLFLTIASVAGLWWEWYHFHWQTIVLAVAMYLLCGFSITVYYHRGITHKSFKMARSLQYVMAILSTGALLLPARKWRMRHEDHHQFTDDPQLDPNCARAGFWGSLDVHIGQVICSRYQDRLIATDLSVDPVELWQAKWYWPMAVSVGFIMPIALASLWDDAIGGFLVASCQRMWLQYNGAFLVNSAAHSALFGTLYPNRYRRSQQYKVLSINNHIPNQQFLL